jgi:hypothetical protein
MKQLALRINLVLVLLMLAVCGEQQREETLKTLKVLKTSLVIVDDALVALASLDKAIQTAIVDACKAANCTHEAVTKRIADYRAAREAIIVAFETAFEDAYRKIATAALATEPEKLLAAVDVAVQRVRDLITKLEALRPSSQAP